MALLASYEFTLSDGEVIRGATLYTKIEPQSSQPDFPNSDIQCDLERVEVVTTSDARFTPKIFWSNAVFGPEGNAKLLLEEREGVPLDIALVEIRKGQTWVVRSEPTMNDRLGITIANDKGKVLFVGIGDLTPVEFVPLKKGLKPKKGHVLTFVFNEIYSWRRSSPMRCGHTSGADQQASPAIYPDYSVPDGGTR